MSDLSFVLGFVGSFLIVASPIVLILRMLVADGEWSIADLFMMPGRIDLGAGPPEPDTSPRWHPERLTRPRRDGSRNRRS